ncbi:MAG: SIS domain-containing protein [Spirochaetaceae bacterium]|nr:SIS domain-containing protein [Spirochaetaceae bacterium]
MDHILNLFERYPPLLQTKAAVEEAFAVMRDSFKAGGKLLVCGNGGSAADAVHIAGELSKGFIKKRPLQKDALSALENSSRGILESAEARALKSSLQRGLPVIPLPAQGALLTAVINDLGADFMYAQQVCAFGKKEDVFLGVSTSGNAKNVVYASVTARAFGLKTIALTGKDGGALKKAADVCVIVPGDETYKIQEYHLPVYHALCLALEEYFFEC